MMVIFIMVVLALLLAALAYINAQSNQNTAYQIAPATGSAASQCFSPNPASPGIGSIPGLGGCSATVACSSTTTASTTSYQISSQGACPAGKLGAGNSPVVALRSVIVGVTTHENVCAACATSCVNSYCTGLFGSCDNNGLKSCAKTCSIAPDDVTSCLQKSCHFGHLFCDTNGLTTCLTTDFCPGGGGGGSVTLNYWLENP
ncbi:MAG: hypothetical protein ACYDAW_13455 [Acidithiobacillus ferrivorans]